jgi:hypothetical protein
MWIRAFTILTAVLALVVTGLAVAQQPSFLKFARNNETTAPAESKKVLATNTPAMPHVAELMVPKYAARGQPGQPNWELHRAARPWYARVPAKQ